ncbi:MAG: protein phosphatase 2C domain-containing protein [Patescibacteria group bacterium]
MGFSDKLRGFFGSSNPDASSSKGPEKVKNRADFKVEKTGEFGIESLETNPELELSLDVSKPISKGKEQAGWRNQDRVKSDGRVTVLCDGLGSSEAGDAAAEAASNKIAEHLNMGVEDRKKEPVMGRKLSVLRAMRMADALRAGDAAVALSNAVENQKSKTTAVAFEVVVDVEEDGTKNSKLIVGSVGDSRVSIFRKGEGLKQITEDDSYLKALFAALHIKVDMNDKAIQHKILREFLKESGVQIGQALDAELNKAWSTQKVGGKDVPLTVGESTIGKARTGIMGKALEGTGHQPSVKVVDLREGDIILGYTDGLSDGAENNEIAQVLEANSDKSSDEIAQLLLKLGLRKQAEGASKNDDVSIEVVKYQGLSQKVEELSDEDLIEELDDKDLEEVA